MQTKGFTLVELIVVITILAILGTIAFISLQGYGAEAKNSKVTSDLRNLVSAIETDRTLNSTKLSDITAGGNTINDVPAATVGSWTLVTATGVSYDVWAINFAAISQSGTDFKDPNADDAEYIYSYAFWVNSAGESFSYYQLAGQLIDNETDKVRITGNYSPILTWTDSLWLISDATTDTALVNDVLATLRP